MYDPSAQHADSYNYNVNAASSSPSPSPPLWSESTQYYPGTVVWHRGTVWRCEMGHWSDSASLGCGAPDFNLHLWTPISSTTPYGQAPPAKQGFEGFSQTYHQSPYSGLGGVGPHWDASSEAGPSSSQPSIIAPKPEPVGAISSPPVHGSHEDEDDSSPDSQGTITGHTSPTSRSLKPNSYQGLGMSTAQFFSSKADESLRFLVAKQEGTKAQDEDEWKDELKGKRVWRVGGLGIWAYDLDEKVEERKAAMWRKWGDKGKGKEEWLETAKERTAFYEQARGVKPLVSWKLVQPSAGLNFPPDALQIGHDGGQVQGHPLFSARAWYGGGMHLGKAGPHLQSGCCISYGGAEITLDTFEVLCAKPDPTLLKWVCFQHGESVRVEGWQPVEGGRERDGQSLFVAKGEWEGGEHPGKCRITDDHAHIGWGGGEVWIRPFYVLAYNNAIRR